MPDTTITYRHTHTHKINSSFLVLNIGAKASVKQDATN